MQGAIFGFAAIVDVLAESGDKAATALFGKGDAVDGDDLEDTGAIRLDGRLALRQVGDSCASQLGGDHFGGGFVFDGVSHSIVGLLLRGKFRSNGAACQWVFFHFEKLFFEGQNGFLSENLRPAFERDVGAVFAVELIACEQQVADYLLGSFHDFFVAEHEKRLPHGRENARVFFLFF